MLKWTKWTIVFNHMFTIESWNGGTVFTDKAPDFQSATVGSA